MLQSVFYNDNYDKNEEYYLQSNFSKDYSSNQTINYKLGHIQYSMCGIVHDGIIMSGKVKLYGLKLN